MMRNKPDMSVTSDTSQSGMSTHPALLHRAKLRSAQFGSVEQHASPLGTSRRHATTASLSATLSGNAHGVSPADTSSPVSNFCFLPFYLSTSSRPSQSSVVFLEVESCFYLVILVSFSAEGSHVKNTTSLGNPSRQQKYRQSKLHRPLGNSTPSTSFLNWMRRRGTITWMSGNRSRSNASSASNTA